MSTANLSQTELPAPPLEKEIAAPKISLPPDDSKMLIIILFLLLIVVLLGAGYFIFGTKQTPPQTSQITPFPTLQPTSTPTPTSILEATDSANWKTFANSSFNYTFQYPSDWDVLPKGLAGVMVAPKNIIDAEKSNRSGEGGVYQTFTIYKNPNLPADIYTTNTTKEVSSEDITISTIRGIKYKTTWLQNLPGGITTGLITYDIKLLYGGNTYVFEILDIKYLDILNKILSTFKFTN